MLRKLVDIIPGVFVAFHKTGAVWSETYVPAHVSNLWYNVGSAFAELQRVLPEWELKSFYWSSSLGVDVIQSFVFVNGPVFYNSCYFVYRGDHSAAVEIVHKSAVAYAEVRADYVGDIVL